VEKYRKAAVMGAYLSMTLPPVYSEVGVPKSTKPKKDRSKIKAARKQKSKG
jgi:hypothetical protein